MKISLPDVQSQNILIIKLSKRTNIKQEKRKEEKWKNKAITNAQYNWVLNLYEVAFLTTSVSSQKNKQ